MIDIKIFHSRQGICAFSMAGHSGYSEEGSDIVCAAASAIAQYLIEAAEQMKVPNRHTLQDGLISFSIAEDATPEQRQKMQDFLLPFQTVMQQLSAQYEAYLKICSLEV